MGLSIFVQNLCLHENTLNLAKQYEMIYSSQYSKQIPLMYRIMFLLVCGFLVQSCNKPVYKYNKEFEGTWQTEFVYDELLETYVMSEIVIDGEDGTFKNTCSPCSEGLCNCLNTHVGKAVMNSSRTQMRIGSSNYALTIDEEPNIDSFGVWTMKVQGLRYYRQWKELLCHFE